MCLIHGNRPIRSFFFFFFFSFSLFHYDMPLLTGRFGRRIIVYYTFPLSFMDDCLPGKVILSFSSMTCRMNGWVAVAAVVHVLERPSNTHLIDVPIQ